MQEGGVLSLTTLWLVLVFLLLWPAAVREVHTMHVPPSHQAAWEPRGASDMGIVRNKHENSGTEHVTDEHPLMANGRHTGRRLHKGAYRVENHEGFREDAQSSLPSFTLASNQERPAHVLESRDEHRGPWPTGNYTAVEGELSEGGGENSQEDNCTHPRQPLPRYNNSCDFVHAECKDKSELIDYLAFVLCDLPKAQVYTCCIVCMYYAVDMRLHGMRVNAQGHCCKEVFLLSGNSFVKAAKINSAPGLVRKSGLHCFNDILCL